AQASVTTDVSIPVTEGSAEHEIVLTAKISGADYTSAPTHLIYKVRSPAGEILLQGEDDVAPGQGFRWAPLDLRFRPNGEGDFKLSLEISQPVSHVDVLVRELR